MEKLVQEIPIVAVYLDMSLSILVSCRTPEEARVIRLTVLSGLQPSGLRKLLFFGETHVFTLVIG